MLNLLKFGLNGPGKIVDHLTANPLQPVEQFPQTSISLHAKVDWHDWCNPTPGMRRERFPVKGKPGDFHEFPSEQLQKLIDTSLTPNWVVDLRYVSGVANSKSQLADYDSFSDMATTASAELLQPATEGQVDHLLNYREVRITKEGPTGDYFLVHGWDPRIYLVNSGGSHHFAAANHLAHQLSIERHLKGTLVTHKINGVALRALAKEYRILAITEEDDLSRLRDLITNFEAPHFHTRMPRAFNGAVAYILPVENNRSAFVADALLKAGALDVVNHLEKLHEMQLTLGHNSKEPLVILA